MAGYTTFTALLHDKFLRPTGAEIVRNMAVTSDGNVVIANSLVNQVGLVEIK